MIVENPLRFVEDELIKNVVEDRPFQTVLIESNLFDGLLLQIDPPGEISKIESLDGQDIVKHYFKRLLKTVFFDDETLFQIRKNQYIQGVRVILYQPMT